MKSSFKKIMLVVVMLLMLTPSTVSASTIFMQAKAKITVYKTASTKKKIAVIAKGDIVRVTGKKKGWYSLNYNGKKGYAKTNKLRELDYYEVMYAKSSVTARQSRKNGSKAIVNIPYAGRVTRMATYGKWSYVKFAKKYGWIPTSKLTEYKPTTSAPQPTAAPVPTATPQPTATPRPTATPYPTRIPTPTPTKTPARPTVTPTPVVIPLPTQAPSQTGTPLNLPNNIDWTGLEDLSVDEMALTIKIWNEVLNCKSDRILIGDYNANIRPNAVYGVIKDTFFGFYKNVFFGNQITTTTSSTGVTRKNEYYVDVKRSRANLTKNNSLKNRCKAIGAGYVKSGMSQREIALALSDAVGAYLTYGSNHDPEKALNSRTGACDMYALLYKGTCELYGLQCHICHGTALATGATKYVNHAWNKVRIGSQWYYIDVCWNDTRGDDKYTLTPYLWSNHKEKSTVAFYTE